MNVDKELELHMVAEPTKIRLYPGDVAREVAERSGMPVAVVNPVVKAFLATVSDQLADGNEIVLPSVGVIFRYEIESPAIGQRLQLRYRPSSRLRRDLQLYQFDC